MKWKTFKQEKITMDTWDFTPKGSTHNKKEEETVDEETNRNIFALHLLGFSQKLIAEVTSKNIGTFNNQIRGYFTNKVSSLPEDKTNGIWEYLKPLNKTYLKQEGALTTKREIELFPSSSKEVLEKFLFSEFPENKMRPKVVILIQPLHESTCIGWHFLSKNNDLEGNSIHGLYFSLSMLTKDATNLIRVIFNRTRLTSKPAEISSLLTTQDFFKYLIEQKNKKKHASLSQYSPKCNSKMRKVTTNNIFELLGSGSGIITKLVFPVDYDLWSTEGMTSHEVYDNSWHLIAPENFTVTKQND